MNRNPIETIEIPSMYEQITKNEAIKLGGGRVCGFFKDLDGGGGGFGREDSSSWGEDAAAGLS